MASPYSPNGIPDGFINPPTTWGDYNNFLFVILQWIAKMQTSTLVQIVACTNDGDTSAVGFVDVVPMVAQIDGAGNATPHGTIYNIPYLRLQGGSNAVILDPQVGDIGICLFASRDISQIKANRAPGNPGSFRQYAYGDGLYLGGVLNGIPTQFIQFNSSGVTITSTQTIHINGPSGVTITTPNVTITGTLTVDNVNNVTNGSTVNGGFKATGGDIVADTISLKTHRHTGVTAGGSDTGGPTP